MDPSFSDFAAWTALGVSVAVGLKQFGVFDRPGIEVASSYLPPFDPWGWPTMPHFMLSFNNVGNLPVVFSDFILAIPRMDALQPDGTFAAHPGAELFIDKRPSSRVGGLQHLSKADFRTNKVHLAPRDFHTDFFDLAAFLPEGWAATDPMKLPDIGQFSPILSFSDSFGNDYYCDEDGIHEGDYVYPHEDAMAASGLPRTKWSHTLKITKSLVSGWTREEVPHRLVPEAAKPASEDS